MLAVMTATLKTPQQGEQKGNCNSEDDRGRGDNACCQRGGIASSIAFSLRKIADGLAVEIAKTKNAGLVFLST